MLLGARERQWPNAECTGLWVERSLCSCAKQGGGVWGSSLVLPWKLGEALPTWATWHKFRLLLLSIWDFCFLWQKLSCAWKYFLKHSSVADQWPLQINLHICDQLLLFFFIFLLESLLYWVIPFFFFAAHERVSSYECSKHPRESSGGFAWNASLLRSTGNEINERAAWLL